MIAIENIQRMRLPLVSLGLTLRLEKSHYVLSETPKVSSETPKVSSETPKVSSETPKVSSETPKVSRWSQLGISKATYYRRKNNGKI